MSKLKITGAVIGGLLGLVLIIGLTVGFQWVSAPFRGAIDARETIQADGDFRIAAYETFFDRCANVQSHEGRIRSLEEELNDPENPPSPSRESQIRSSLTAIRSQRSEDINFYNSEASRDWTVGQFRDEGLPHELDIDAEETDCTV